MKRFIDLQNPINWASPLNYKLRNWWLIIQQLMGSSKLYDLCRKDNGILTNGTLFTGSIGRFSGIGSLYFDATDDFVTIPPIVISGDLTFSAWFRRIHSGDVSLSIFGESTSSENGFAISDEGINLWQVRFEAENAAINVSSSVTDYISGNWNHLALARTGSTCTCYFNGRNIGTGTQSATPTFTAIGKYQNTVQEKWLDDLRIWNRALTSNEIISVYNDSKFNYNNTLNYITRRSYFIQSSSINRFVVAKSNNNKFFPFRIRVPA